MCCSRLVVLPALLILTASAAVSSVGDAEYVALRRMIGQERYNDAITTCIDLIRDHPEVLSLYEALPEVAQYAGRIDKAVAFFESRVEDGTALPLVYYGLGTAFYSKHDYRTAVVYFNNAIEAGNSTAECYRGLEYAYEKLEGLDAATRYFNLLCHRDPQNPNNWYGLALAYWTRQDYDRVKSCLSEALARRPGERRYIQAQVAAAYLRGETDSVVGRMSTLIATASEELDFGGKEFLKSFVVIGHFNRDRYQSAMQTIEEIINDSKTYGYLRWLGWGYKRMSDVKFLMGEYQLAITFAKEAAAVAEKVGDEELILAALSRQFEVYSEIGDYYDALETAYMERNATQKEEVSRECIRPLVDIACALHDMGSDDIALEFAIEALGKCETLKTDSRLLYQIQMCLGLIYEGLESFDESVRHFKLAADLIPVDNFWARNIAVCHGHLGRALLRIKKYSDAKRHFLKQLTLAGREGYDREVCYAEAYLGMLYLEQGKNDVSRSLFQRAYEKGIHLGQLPSILICARGLSTLAERANRLGEAVLWREKAISTTESMGLWHERLMSLGCSDRELVRDYHEYVRLLCSLRRLDKAFEAAEKAKALWLAKLVNIPQVEKSIAGSDPVRVRLLSLQKEIIRLHSILASQKPPVVPANSTNSSLDVISELNHLEMTFQKILDTLRVHNDRFYVLLKPAVYSPREIQESLLDAKGAIIEFVVGEHSTSVIVVGKDTLGSFEAEISDRDLKLLMGRISKVLVEGKRKLPIMNAAIADINLEALHKTFQLLFERALPFIRKASHLTIVTDGILSNFPFELLVTSMEGGSSSLSQSGPRFLIEDFEIDYALSAALALDERSCVHQASRTILGVGDVVNSTTSDEPGAVEATRESGVLSAKYVHSYPGVRRELAAIKRIFGSRADLLSQRDATPKTFSKVASQYRILHIAAHVDFDESKPLYSMIVLSPDISIDGNEGIRAIDFLSFELNADLVVLSGCNTGRMSSRAELTGMTSTIMLSGVPSVVASLWNVDDEVTAQMMESFYASLNAGRGKGESLRMAKLEMMRSGKSDPFYWGAFVLCGDGGKLPIGDEPLGLTAPATMTQGILGIAIVWTTCRILRRRHRKPESQL